MTHSDDFYLQYLDIEQDKISLCSDLELEALIQMYKESPIRIYVYDGKFHLETSQDPKINSPIIGNNVVLEPPTPQEIQEMNKFLEEQGFKNQSNIDHLSQTNENTIQISKETETVSLVDHHLPCKHCLNNIIGIRWLCSVCSGFDLCQDCESLHDKSHPLVRIVEPISRSSEALYKLCSSLQNSKDRLSRFNNMAYDIAHSVKSEISTIFSSVSTHTKEATTGIIEKVQKIPSALHLTKACKEEEISGQDLYSIQNAKFETLEELGFCDRDQNEMLLILHDGDLNACIEHYMGLNANRVD
jgi:hypothetical protein